jgi:hypothetical protein
MAIDWVVSRRNAEGRALLARVVVQLDRPAVLPQEARQNPLPRLIWLLGELRDGVTLTQKGNLNRGFVQAAAARFDWPFDKPPRHEDDLFLLQELRALARRMHLLRRTGRTVVLTKRGATLLSDGEGLWRAATREMLPGDHFVASVGELTLAYLLTTSRPVYDEMIDVVSAAIAGEGFVDVRTGQEPDKRDISWAIHRSLDSFRALDLFVEGDRLFSADPYRLTTVGVATALETLRMRFIDQ